MNAASQFDDATTSQLKSDVVDRTITILQQMKGDLLVSGDDSVLQNTWEEVCVQVQGEESFFWEIHLDIIEDLLDEMIEPIGVPADYSLDYFSPSLESYKFLTNFEELEEDEEEEKESGTSSNGNRWP